MGIVMATRKGRRSEAANVGASPARAPTSIPMARAAGGMAHLMTPQFHTHLATFRLVFLSYQILKMGFSHKFFPHPQ